MTSRAPITEANIRRAIARTLPARDACAYAGCRTMQTFYRWQRIGRLPRAIPGTHSYSKDDIDAHLDRWSGNHRTVPAKSAYEEWRERESTT